MSVFELAIVAFIILSILYHVWKGGSANPVGTGRLQGAVGKLRTEVTSIGEGLKALDQAAAKKIDLELLKQSVDSERERVEKAFATLERVTLEVAEIREAVGKKHIVIDALAESVRVISSELQDVSRRLDQLASMSDRIEANRQAIIKLTELCTISDNRQDRMSEQVASTQATVEAIGKQIDRIYSVIVPKGMGS